MSWLEVKRRKKTNYEFDAYLCLEKYSKRSVWDELLSIHIIYVYDLGVESFLIKNLFSSDTCS